MYRSSSILVQNRCGEATQPFPRSSFDMLILSMSKDERTHRLAAAREAQSTRPNELSHNGDQFIRRARRNVSEVRQRYSVEIERASHRLETLVAEGQRDWLIGSDGEAPPNRDRASLPPQWLQGPSLHHRSEAGARIPCCVRTPSIHPAPAVTGPRGEQGPSDWSR